MPLELGVWRIDGSVRPVEFGQLDLESRLEEILAGDIKIAHTDWMIIGRQVRTPFGTIIDLLALDSQGEVVVVELKRDKTPRDIVAQVLEYGAWAKTLKAEDIARLFQEYQKTWFPTAKRTSLDDAFVQRFLVKEMPEELNEAHQLVIVASALDSTTERVVTYLLDHYKVSINAVFFRVYKDEGREYLARAWLHDPVGVEAGSTGTVNSAEWNGEYYVSYGGQRDWGDAVKYGFISAGGGRWYSNTLQQLEKGARIWVHIPGTGYVGVGVVEEPVVPCEEFLATDDKGHRSPLVTLSASAKSWTTSKDDPDNAEYVVRVRWLKTVNESQAVWEKGFFGNQNTVAQPTSDKWNHTVERLKGRFGLT